MKARRFHTLFLSFTTLLPSSFIHRIIESTENFREKQRKTEKFREIQRNSEIFRDGHSNFDCRSVLVMYLCIDKPKQPKVMYEIKIFENPDFGQVRTTTGENGAPFFCAVDVCRALGYGNSREALRKHVMEDDVTKRDTIDSLGRKQQTSFINGSERLADIFR